MRTIVVTCLILGIFQALPAAPQPGAGPAPLVNDLYNHDDQRGLGPISRVLGPTWIYRFLCQTEATDFEGPDGTLLTREEQRFNLDADKIKCTDTIAGLELQKLFFRKRCKYSLGGRYVMSKWFDRDGRPVGNVDYEDGLRAKPEQAKIQETIAKILAYRHIVAYRPPGPAAAVAIPSGR